MNVQYVWIVVVIMGIIGGIEIDYAFSSIHNSYQMHDRFSHYNGWMHNDAYMMHGLESRQQVYSHIFHSAKYREEMSQYLIDNPQSMQSWCNTMMGNPAYMQSMMNHGMMNYNMTCGNAGMRNGGMANMSSMEMMHH